MHTIVTLEIILDDEGRYAHPTTWDWHDLLDLGLDDDVTVVGFVDVE